MTYISGRNEYRRRIDLPDDFLSRVDLRRMYPDKRGNPIMVHCPQHGDRGKPNLAVYAQNVYCFHPSCHWHAGVLEYIRRVRRSNMHDTLEYAKTLMQVVPVVSGAAMAMRVVVEPLASSVAEQYTRNMAAKNYRYLLQRYGLTKEVVQAAQIGHTGHFPHAYTIPVYSLQGELQNIRFRVDPQLMQDTSTKYWGMTGRNNTELYIPPPLLSKAGESLLDKVRTSDSRFGWCYLTEGELDAVAMMELMGQPAVSTTNGARAFQNMSPDLKALMKGVRWLVAYDQDDTGREAGFNVARKLTELYGPGNVRIVSWNPKEGKDASELLASGAGRNGGLAWYDDIFTIKSLDITESMGYNSSIVRFNEHNVSGDELYG